VPTRIAEVKVPGSAFAITLGGDYTYIASGYSSILPIRTPHVLKNIQVGGFAYASVRSGNYLYLATGLLAT